jgi:peptidoglycan hydrolase-like protein with peptidoglycan-binding domain
MHDESQEMIDTAPAGTYPDEPVSFDTGGEDLDRPQHDPHEPWDEFDSEALEDLEGPLSFGGPVALADTSSYERWLQSAVKALVAPELEVDGELGPRTRVAVKTFQRRVRELRPGAAALGVDGIAGPKTIAELELQTASKAPTRHEGDDAETPVLDDSEPVDERADTMMPPATTATPTTTTTVTGNLTVTEEQVDGAVEYAISDGKDTVRFSYWTPDFATTSPTTSAATRARARACSRTGHPTTGYSASAKCGSSRPTRSRSRAARSGRSTPGTTSSCRGAWPSSPARPAPSPPSSPTSRTTPHQAPPIDVVRRQRHRRRLRQVPVEAGEVKTGWHVVVAAGGEGAARQPRLAAHPHPAEPDRRLPARRQRPRAAARPVRLLARRLPPPRDQQAHRPCAPTAPARRARAPQYITSERGLALSCACTTGCPATWSAGPTASSKSCRPSTPAATCPTPTSGTRHLEDAFVKKISDERKRVKSGSYDTYALDLSRVRGSFTGKRSAV